LSGGGSRGESGSAPEYACFTQRPRIAAAVTSSATSDGARVLEARDHAGDRTVVAGGDAFDRLVVAPSLFRQDLDGILARLA